jgi:hypothetical protein
MGRNMCGTLADFERLAKTTCLQMEAREHTTTAEGITLASNCLAAKITASKVQFTAEAAKKRHERAIAAQEELGRLQREQEAAFPGSTRAARTNVNSHQFDAAITPSEPKEGDPNLPRWRETHQPSRQASDAAPPAAVGGHRASERLVGSTCNMGGCFDQYIEKTATDLDGVISVWLKFSAHDNSNPRVKARAPTFAFSKVLCNSPGGYIENEGHTRLHQPNPQPSHATEASDKLWAAICSP